MSLFLFNIPTNSRNPTNIIGDRHHQQTSHAHYLTSLSPSARPPLLMSDFLVTDSAPAGMAANGLGGVTGGGGPLLQCTDDRTGGLAGWPVGGSHNSALSTPTLWQYPGKYTWWMTHRLSLALSSPTTLLCFVWDGMRFFTFYIRENLLWCLLLFGGVI